MRERVHFSAIHEFQIISFVLYAFFGRFMARCSTPRQHSAKQLRFRFQRDARATPAASSFQKHIRLVIRRLDVIERLVCFSITRRVDPVSEHRREGMKRSRRFGLIILLLGTMLNTPNLTFTYGGSVFVSGSSHSRR